MRTVSCALLLALSALLTHAARLPSEPSVIKSDGKEPWNKPWFCHGEHVILVLGWWRSMQARKRRIDGALASECSPTRLCLAAIPLLSSPLPPADLDCPRFSSVKNLTLADGTMSVELRHYPEGGWAAAPHSRR